MLSAKPDRLLGAILRGKGYVTGQKLEAALEAQRGLPSLKLGEILVFLGHLTREQLAEALEEQDMTLRLGEILLMRGDVSQYDLDEALETQFQTGRRLGEVLIEMGLCTQETVMIALRSQARSPKPEKASKGRSTRFRRDR